MKVKNFQENILKVLQETRLPDSTFEDYETTEVSVKHLH